MTDALFSALDAPSASHHRTGYRLHRIEVFNWGTFDKSVWTIRPDGQTSLLTGDIGSGKSTLVDAITTLLLPAHRIAYNKAAGADVRERTLRSYVEGHYKSERNEATGASRPVGLRDHTSYSVILGVFVNEGYDEQVTIAQVFHQKDRTGQPDRFFVTAQHALSIDPDFSDFGSALTSLRARLRAGGADIDNTFPDYHRRVRRLLGIRSEQAMDLFHQTVSMKSVGNLNDFVRDHMLEPVSAEEKVKGIVDHFEDLVAAHEAVRTATEQLALLTPLVASADRYEAAVARHGALTAERSAVIPYISERVRELLAAEISTAHERLDGLDARRRDLDTARDALTPERNRLLVERAGVGGDRLGALDIEIPRAAALRDARAERGRLYAAHLAAAGMEPVADAGDFLARAESGQLMRDRLDADRAHIRTRQEPLYDERAGARAERGRVAAEIEGLRARRNSLPEDLDRVRRRLCAELGLDEDDVPFAGELLDVRDEFREWRGAAERVLRGFALSMLVPQAYYDRVSRWINDNHLRARLVFLRVAERRVRTVPAARTGIQLVDALEIETGPVAAYLEAELAVRADHVLAASVDQLQREERAVTREGLIRDRDRHEKDDRRSAADPRSWVLGRGSELKIAALEDELADIDGALAGIERDLRVLDDETTALARRGQALTALAQYPTWADVDVEEATATLASLEAERDRLVAGSSQLAAIDERIEALAVRERELGGQIEDLVGAVAGIRSDLARLEQRERREDDALALMGPEVLDRARPLYPALAERSSRADLRTVDDCDRLRETLTGALTSAIEQTQREAQREATGIQQQMAEVLRRWPVLRQEMDAGVEAIGDFRALYERVHRDDLPRFEGEFRRLLDTNAVNDLLAFHTWLRRQAEEISTRVEVINEALGAIDYNPGRRIVLIAEPTVNQDVRAFRSDLREATSDALGGEAVDPEVRFERIRALIEKFKGRVGHADGDRQWTRRVTDVRNWFTFAASEQDRLTGEEFEHYTDSDGKSGGQKEKLAYTILAASLAYQFGLEWGVERSRDFRFAVIDEAFGRGSDASTRYALDLFAKLGLQLLIVTPLQKVHVIEPYVSAIGFVDNPTGSASRVYTLTIEEFRERQRGAFA